VTPRILLDRIVATLRAGRKPRYSGTRGLGQRWEGLATKHLEAAGYVIRERNFRGRTGEIDLVAEESGVLCFIEVKGRSGTGFGLPAEAVTAAKQRRIARAAQEYLMRRRLPSSTRCRFDVVSVLDSGGMPEVTILRGAFAMPEARGPRA
jgi:putative endonuclease